MNTDKIIPVVFSFDKNYIPYAKVAINSVFAKCSSRIKLYCFGLDLQESDFDYFRETAAKFGGEFEGVHFTSDQLSEFEVTKYFTKTTYLRIFIPKFVKEDKVIYCDCDTLFFTDVTELYDMPFDGKYIIGAEDWSSINMKNSGFDRIEKLDLPKDDTYINCGIIVLDNKSLIEMDFVKLCYETNLKYKDKLQYVDQCVINKVLEGKKKIMQWAWNFQFISQFQSLDHILPQPAVHYVGETKLWMASQTNPRNHEIWLAAALSYGLKKEELAIK